MSGKKEVKGQIKLKFSNIKGQKMICSRSMAVSVKKGGGLTQKTIDSSLLRFDPITHEVNHALFTLLVFTHNHIDL